MTLDPVTYALVSQALIAIGREMGAKLVRSAYSSIIRESRDASAALLDRHGHVVAQAELIPMHLSAMAETFAPCAARWPVDTLGEGDFYIINDPYHGGQHLPDVYIFSPVFFEGALVGFAGSTAHHLDLGGGSPGLNAAAEDVYQEGLIFPPARYNHERDWLHGPLRDMVAANIRVPERTIGDFDAQFAANSVGVARVIELCRKYGPESVMAAMAELQDYAERRLRAAIRDVPDGVYRGQDAADDDGLNDAPLTIEAEVTVEGDSITIDFAGSCAQSRRNVNSPFSSTLAAAQSCVKSVLTGADVPFNDGTKRPITVKAPYGSILNPRPPAPVRARMVSSYRAYNAAMRALAEAVPERVAAGGYDTTTAVCLSHLGPAGYRVTIEVYGGGLGASAVADGCDAVDGPLSNCSNTPVEAQDMEVDHFRIVEYALVPDSCGHGRFRGGLGIRRTYEVLKDDVTLSIYADRFRTAPKGLFGGTDGRPARCEVVRGGEVIPVRSKDSVALRRGDLLVVTTGGGAGYGDPATRPAAAVAADIAQGYVAAATAASAYCASAAAGSPATSASSGRNP